MSQDPGNIKRVVLSRTLQHPLTLYPTAVGVLGAVGIGLFGPVTVLYRARDLDEAIALANDSPYGLTAAIHTASVHRALRFAEAVQAGVVVVNLFSKTVSH